jgi:hypothetical protein
MTEPCSTEAAPSARTEKLQPTALSVKDAAKLLTAVGGRTITPEMIARDTDNGAPVNPDGTLNLIQYAAWIVKEMASRGD